MSRSAHTYRTAYQRGLWAEHWCSLWLAVRGYRILARRHRTPFGEIDLIARRGHVLVCIEVKARPSKEDGLYAITPRQQQRILRAATSFVGQHPKYAGLTLRFDLMVVARRFRIHHIPSAFMA